MFTGIVQEVGTLIAARRTNAVDRLTIQAPKTAQGLAIGESVAVNGACLSVVQADAGRLVFEMIPETRRLTNLGALREGASVNLERSLTLSDRLNGHVVLGHVDGLGRILRRRTLPGQVVLDIAVERGIGRWLVPKGPITVDGVSLTVGPQPTSTRCSVFLIPETLRKTTLGCDSHGSVVNLEVDYFAKLLAQMASARYKD